VQELFTIEDFEGELRGLARLKRSKFFRSVTS